MSLTVTIIILALALAALAGSVAFAIKSRTSWTETQKDHARAMRVTRALVGETGCGLALPPSKGSRPTHPDGTPYRYHEIAAEGWGHCDGCRQWGQWTIQDPHYCQQTINVAVAFSDPAAIGADVARILRRTRRRDV